MCVCVRARSPCRIFLLVGFVVGCPPSASDPLEGLVTALRAQLHGMRPSCQSCCDASDAAYAGLCHLKPCAVKRICISNTGEAFFPFCPGGCVPCMH